MHLMRAEMPTGSSGPSVCDATQSKRACRFHHGREQGNGQKNGI
eukprot:CAMPEP_0180683562 /NCGR_PEP_ID=MMETSP1037_2-20121125/71265_1 /TAXON_ID=632150 /ORGANISM="Azadinium spinosum, Strain 3D9" /LENGTH=43 /DNA_ID= /DNA_START= /DNA_END= /DNA_ORIENTATION=